MPRSARIVIPGAAHHVTQRGNNQQTVFLDDEDRMKYLDLLRHYGESYHLRIVGYCLMTNHIHLIVVPGFTSSLGDAVGRAHQLYSEFFNTKYARNGHLWQNRYFSCPMDMEHTLNALAYVELNPVRAGMVREPWDYAWSSAAAHVGERGDRMLNLSRWFREIAVDTWIENLGDFKENRAAADQIRRCTRKGRPLGRNAGFLAQVGEYIEGQRRGMTKP